MLDEWNVYEHIFCGWREWKSIISIPYSEIFKKCIIPEILLFFFERKYIIGWNLACFEWWNLSDFLKFLNFVIFKIFKFPLLSWALVIFVRASHQTKVCHMSRAKLGRHSPASTYGNAQHVPPLAAPMVINASTQLSDRLITCNSIKVRHNSITILGHSKCVTRAHSQAPESLPDAKWVSAGDFFRAELRK